MILLGVVLVVVVAVLVEVNVMLIKNKVGGGLRRGQKRMVFVDTSALIDGRILTVAETGFLSDRFLVPRSVVRELQLLADSSGNDSEKRARARFGLDVVSDLQKLPGFTIEIYEDELPVPEGVDERLIRLALDEGPGVAAILTVDFNLGKVAATEKIAVLNVNDLAKAIRSAYLPGDKMQLALVKTGSSAGQAVGYLPDGTMVVVEGAAAEVGRTVWVEFLQYLQTSAGKMMFAKKVRRDGDEKVDHSKPADHGKQAQKPEQRRGHKKFKKGPRQA